MEKNSFQHPLWPSNSQQDELLLREIIKESVDDFNANAALFGAAHIKQRTKIPVIFYGGLTISPTWNVKF